MSLLASKTDGRTVPEDSSSGTARRFKASMRLRLQSFKEAVQEGEVPEGTVWLVRIIEAGKSLNGPTYTEEALKASIPVFEGAPVFNYAWSEDPASKDAGHLPDEIAAIDARGLTGNQVGSLEGVHFNETAKSLDAYLKVYDTKLRERMLTAFKVGDIGEGGNRDVFGLSIDALGDQDEAGNVVRINAANSVDLVSTPAAGGRIRRLVAALGGDKATSSAPGEIPEEVKGNHQQEALTHNSTLGDDEPDWGEVDKARLPDSAHANDSRGFPHHWVKGGGELDDAGRYTSGDMFLHKGGLDAAWAAAQGARSGEKASPEVIAHLSAHREALGLEESVKNKLTEKLVKVVLKENALEEKARFGMLMRAVQDELWDLDHGERAGIPTAEKVQVVQSLANDLVSALGSGGMQESFVELKENAATLAGQLKLSADKLSTASDEDVPKLLEAIRDSITEALDELSKAGNDDESAESQEANGVKKDEQAGSAAATTDAAQDDFARMSAGLGKLGEALKSGDPVKLREAAVAVVGEEPQLDEKDKTINALKEKLKSQAIDAAMVKLTEDLQLADGAGPMVLRLIDRSALTFDDDFKEVKGLKEAISSVVKDFPGFVRVTESADDGAASAEGGEGTGADADQGAAKPEGERKAEALTPKTPQEAAAEVMDKGKGEAAKPLGQVALKESFTGDAGGARKPTPGDVARLRRYQRQMLAGKVGAMKKHRDLRAQLGL